MTDKMAFVCDEVTPEMIALDEMLATDDLTGVCPVGFDEEEWVEITREITIDPSKYRSPNYQPAPGSIPQSEPDPDDDTSDDLPPEPYGQDEAIAIDATLPCNTPFANCQAKNPLLCPYHGAKLIEADIKAGLAQAIPNAVVKVSAHKSGQAQGKNFSISIKVPASQKLAAEKALDDFLQQPGIKSKGMKDWDPRSNEWSDFYDVDLLQLNSAPQGGMANRAALANSIGQSLSPQQPSQQQTPQATPASQQTTATTPQQQSPNQMGTPAKSGHIFKTTYPTGPMTQPIQKNTGGWAPSQGVLNAIQTALGSAYNWKGLTWNKSFDKLNVAYPNPTMQQGQAIADSLGNGYVVQVRGKSGFTIYPANQMPAQSQQQTSQPVQQQSVPPPQQLATGMPTTTTVNGKSVNVDTVTSQTAGYIETQMSSVKEDEKWRKEAKKSGILNNKDSHQLKGLIEDKGLLLDKYNALKEKIDKKLISSMAEPIVRNIMDGLAVGIENKDKEILAIKEAVTVAAAPKTYMPTGAGAKEIMEQMKKMKAPFVCRMLSTYDNGLNRNLAHFRSMFENWMMNYGHRKHLDSNGKLTDQNWEMLRDLYKKSMADYFSRVKLYSFHHNANAILDSFVKFGGYAMTSSCRSKLINNFGMGNVKDEDKYFSTSCLDLAEDEIFSHSDTSDLAKSAAQNITGFGIEWRKDNAVVCYGMTNWYSKDQNGNCAGLMSSPEVTSMILTRGGGNNDPAAEFLLKLLETRKPIKVSQSIESAWRSKGYIGNSSHNECPYFTGCGLNGTGVPNARCIKALHFPSRKNFDSVSSQNLKWIKDNKIPCYISGKLQPI